MPRRSLRSKLEEEYVEYRPTRPVCPNCGKAYATASSEEHDNGRLPLVLSCGHDLCRSCLWQCVKGEGRFKPGRGEGVICPFCTTHTALPEAEHSICDLPVDLFVTGMVAVQQHTKKSSTETSEQKKWYGPSGFSLRVPQHGNVFNKMTGISKFSRSSSSTSEQKKSVQAPCIECQDKSSEVYCDVCDALYCNACFDKVHERFDVLRSKHKRLPLEDRELSRVNCPDHPGSKVEYFCVTDKTCVCMRCVAKVDGSSGRHVGHAITGIGQQMAVMLETIHNLRKDLDAHLDCVHLALNQSYDILKELKESSLRTMEGVHREFRQLHRNLQMREEQVLSEAHDTLSIQVGDMLEGRHVLKSKMSEAQRALILCDRATKSQDEAVVLKAHESLRKVLASGQTMEVVVQDEVQPIRFFMDDDLPHMMLSVGDLMGSASPMAVLVPVSLDQASASQSSKYARGFDCPLVHHRKSSGEDYLDEEYFVQDESDIDDDDSTFRAAPVRISHAGNGISPAADSEVVDVSHNTNTTTTRPVAEAARPTSPVKPSTAVVSQTSSTAAPAATQAERAATHAEPTGIKSQAAASESDKPAYDNPASTSSLPKLGQNTGARKPQTLVSALHAHLAQLQNPSQQSQGMNLLHSRKAQMEVIMPKSETRASALPAPSNQSSQAATTIPTPPITPTVTPSVTPLTTPRATRSAARTTPTAAVSPSTGVQGSPAHLHEGRAMAAGEVSVLEVGNPDMFTIQYVKDAQRLAEMSSILQEHAGRCGQDNGSLAVSVGDKVGALYSEDRQWYRGVVKALSGGAVPAGLPPPPSQSSATGGRHVFVEYMDYGNFAWVQYENVVPLPLELLAERPCVYYCALANIVPGSTKKGSGWSPEAVKALHGLVEGKRFIAKVFSSEGKKYRIDLRGFDDGSVASVADSLVFMRHARISGDKTTSNSSSSRISRSPLPAPRPAVELFTVELPDNAFCDVRVCSAVSPADFYVQQLENDAILEDMIDKLNSMFAKRLPSHRPLAIVPGSFYCTQYSLDAQWYRVKVLKVGSKLATVQFIDYGNSEDVKVSGIYNLAEELIKIPCQAVHCCLPDILPPKGALKWSPQAGEKLETCCVNNCVLLVKGKPLPSGCLPVQLVDTMSVPNDDIVIADELVRLGIAEKSRRSAFPAGVAATSTTEKSVLPAHPVSAASKETGSLPADKRTPLEARNSLTMRSQVDVSTLPPTRPPIGASSGVELPATRPPTGTPLARLSGDQAVASNSARPGVPLLNSTVGSKPFAKDNRRDYSSSEDEADKLYDPETNRTVARRSSPPPLTAEDLKSRHEEDMLRRDKLIQRSEKRILAEKMKQSPALAAAVGGGDGDGGSSEDSDDSVAMWAEDIPLRNAFNTMLTSKLPVTVITVDNPTQFYVHFHSPDFEQRLNSMMDAVHAHCQGMERFPDNFWSVGKVCCAIFSEDGVWYRGRITELFELTRAAEVFFVDYGNKEAVSFDNLRPLSVALSFLPQLASRCHLSKLIPYSDGIASPEELASREVANRRQLQWSDTAIAYFHKLASYAVIKIDIQGQRVKGSFPSDILYAPETIPDKLAFTPKSMSTALTDAGLAAPFSKSVQYVSRNPTDVPVVAPPLPEEFDPDVAAQRYQAAVMPKYKMFFIYITFVDSRGCLYGHFAGTARKPDEKMARTIDRSLHADMIKQRPQQSAPQIRLGQAGCFRSRNTHWYRCHVSAIFNANDIEVYLVDYGRTEQISPVKFYTYVHRRDIPQLAVKFYVEGLVPAPVGYVWPDEAVDVLDDLVIDQKLGAKFIAGCEDYKPPCLAVQLRSGVSVFCRMEARKLKDIPFLSAADLDLVDRLGHTDELAVVATDCADLEVGGKDGTSAPAAAKLSAGSAKYAIHMPSVPDASQLPMPTGLLAKFKEAEASTVAAASAVHLSSGSAEGPSPVLWQSGLGGAEEGILPSDPPVSVAWLSESPRIGANGLPVGSYRQMSSEIFTIGSEWRVVIGNVTSLDCLDLQPVCSVAATGTDTTSIEMQYLFKLQQAIGSIIQTLNSEDCVLKRSPRLTSAVADQPCAVLTDDQTWHRARVVSMLEDSQVHVQLVDYGSAQLVPIDRLCALPNEFTKVPCWMVQAQIQGFSPLVDYATVPALMPDGDWTIDAYERFKTLTSNQSSDNVLTVKILENKTLPLSVTLYCNGVNVAEQLAVEGMAVYTADGVPDYAADGLLFLTTDDAPAVQ